MTSEATEQRQKRMKIWIAVSSALLLVVVIVVLVKFAAGDRKKNVAFRVVDYATGEPITNVYVGVTARWTKARIERLRLPGLSPWRSYAATDRGGSVNINESRSFTAVFVREGYAAVMFSRGPNEDWIKNEGDKSIKYFPATNLVTIRLQREEP